MMKPLKSQLYTFAFVSSMMILASSSLFAADEYNVANGLTLAGTPLGLHGVDPVSMFDDKSPLIGDAVHTANHDGVGYYFTSATAKNRFEADPEAYLPQFGGFCALGVSLGKKLDGDVRYADIVNGKLYLFVNSAVFQKYLENRNAVLVSAYEKWPEIKHTAVEDL